MAQLELIGGLADDGKRFKSVGRCMRAGGICFCREFEGGVGSRFDRTLGRRIFVVVPLLVF